MRKREAVVINPSARLKGVQHKVIWGGRPAHRVHSSNVVTLMDNEFVTLSGSGLLLFENASVFNRKSKIIDCKDMNILYVKSLAVTKDGKFLAAVVKLNREDNTEINILIFHTKNHFQDFVKPRSIKYSGGVHLRPGENLETTAIAFSHDSVYLAVATNIPFIGILIYDQYKGSIFQTITTDSIAISISFHPTDANKLLGTGDQNLIKFWKFTAKSVHLASVSGLKRGNHTYTAHGWVAPYAENTIVVGTNNGFVTTIQNCEQRVAAQQVFGSAGNNPIGCLQMLIRGDHVIVSSTRNLIVLFELRRIVIQKYMGLTCVMVPLKFYRINDINRICGLQFCFKESITAYSMVATTEESMVVLEMITDSDLSGAGMKKNDGHPESQDSFEMIDWFDCTSSKVIGQFHNGAVQSLSIATRAKTFVTSSFQDGSVRVWYYDEPSMYNYAWIVENYRDRMDENPFHVDIHPSGLQVAFACENEVREYAVCDNGFDIIRRFIIRNAFQGPGGAPVIINQPVSLVKYSQGGHMIAVVTGKVAQVFHLYHPDDDAPGVGNQSSSSAALGPIENPYRLMALLDHINPITDLSFFRDDKCIVTTSSDGSVYSWVVGATQRSKEYLHKGIAATHVAVTKHLKSRVTIIASFESLSSDAVPVAAEIIKRRRLSSFAMRRISSSGSAAVDGNLELRGSRNTNDLAAMASAFLKEFEGKNSGAPGTPDPYNTKPSTASQPPKPFVAVWTDDISHNPKIIQVDAPVRSIALGRAGYPDPYDLCAMGLADGRIIISMIPIPFIEVNIAPSPSHTISMSAATNVATHIVKLNSGLKKKRGLMTSPSRDDNFDATSPLSRSKSAVVDDMNGGFGARGFAGDNGNTSFNFHDAIQVFGGKELGASAMANLNNPPLTPLMTMNNLNGGAPDDFVNGDLTSPNGTITQFVLDEANCKILRIAVGSVSNVAFSPDGSQMIATAEDGSVHLIATVRKFSDFNNDLDGLGTQSVATIMTNMSTNTAATATTTGSNPAVASSNHFFMVERSKMTTVRSKLTDLEGSIEQGKKEFELQLNKALENKDKQFHDIEIRLKKEISKREETIVNGRKEYLTMRKEMQQEIEDLQKYSQEALSTMETNYEKRLSQEALYLEKMKQAYDEYVVHAKMDMIQLHHQTDHKIEEIENEKKKLIEDIEKQKAVVLKYYDYVKDRNTEILNSLEEQQTEERLQMKNQLNTAATRLIEAQALNMTQEVQASRTIQRLKVDIENKELEIMRVNSDIDWANDRIRKLEAALTQATTELKARSELVERSEGKLGESQQRIDDLERIRKTLTTQVHLLQSQLDPKEKELSKIREKMQELTREYDISLHAITEKETSLGQKNENLALLQKQVRELRIQLGQREASLRRAATFFEEFIYAMHAEKFNAKKKIPLSLLKASQGLVSGAMSDGMQTSRKSEKGDDMAIKNTLKIDTARDEPNLGGTGNTTARRSLPSDHLAQSKTHDLVTTLSFDRETTLKLKRLEEILKPFVDDTKIDAELSNDLEAVQNEQERRVQLLHRNLHVLQSSLESVNQAASNKVLNHLVDNQTLLKEVNNLRMEVKSLSTENDRLSAFLSSQAAGLTEFRRKSRQSSPPISRDMSFNSNQQPQQRSNNHTDRSYGRPLSGMSMRMNDSEGPTRPISHDRDRILHEPVNETHNIDEHQSPSTSIGAALFPPFPKRYETSSIREEPSRASTHSGSELSRPQSKTSAFQLASSNILQPQRSGVQHIKINSMSMSHTQPALDTIRAENSSQLSHLSRSHDSLPQPMGSSSTGKLQLNGKSAEEKIAELMNLNLQEIRDYSLVSNSQAPAAHASSTSLSVVTPSLRVNTKTGKSNRSSGTIKSKK